MRKLLALAVVIAICLIPMVAMAFLPGDAYEVQAWEYVDNTWVPQTGVTANARCFASGFSMGYCNKEKWEIPVVIHASVAQWLEYSMSGTRWDWKIRKPGTFAADCITASVASNNGISIAFEDFGPLVRDPQSGPGGTDPDEIDIMYGYDTKGSDPAAINWISTETLNAQGCHIDDSDALHAGYSVKLWNKIVVERCDSSCEYEDTAKIVITLDNVKHWIDPATGFFKDPLIVKPS